MCRGFCTQLNLSLSSGLVDIEDDHTATIAGFIYHYIKKVFVLLLFFEISVSLLTSSGRRQTLVELCAVFST